MQSGRHHLVLQEDLLLPRHEQERSDNPIRPPYRSGRSCISQRQAHQDHQDPSRGGPWKDQEDLRHARPGRLQQIRYPPGGDRHRTRPCHPRRGEGIPGTADRGHQVHPRPGRELREEHPLRLQHFGRKGEVRDQERHRSEERRDRPDLRDGQADQDSQGRRQDRTCHHELRRKQGSHIRRQEEGVRSGLRLHRRARPRNLPHQGTGGFHHHQGSTCQDDPQNRGPVRHRPEDGQAAGLHFRRSGTVLRDGRRKVRQGCRCQVGRRPCDLQLEEIRGE